MMRPPNLSLLSEAPKTATERGCRIRSSSTRGRARSATAAACRACVTSAAGLYHRIVRRQTHCISMVRRGIPMTSRTIRLALGVTTLALAAALPASAQSVETRGVVQRVDTSAGIVYFTDGRTVRLEPGSRLTVDGRAVTLAEGQPGW